MNKIKLCIAVLVVGIVGIGTIYFAREPELDSLYARALVNPGDTSRLQRVFDKGSAGEDLTIGVIGGSITEGYYASTPERRWANLVVQWWRKKFPQAKIRLVNAGVKGTMSLYGAHRAKEDLLQYEPDFVVVEFSVNDINTVESAVQMEGLLRQILKAENKPALMLLSMMEEDGTNAQEYHSQVGKYYNIPIISYRDALWPEIENGNISWGDISSDYVHPNDRGHKYCASLITRFLDQYMQEYKRTKKQREILNLPDPLLTDTFEHTNRFRAISMKPVANKGWYKDKSGWVADKPGSEIVFEVPGDFITVISYKTKKNPGVVEISIDGKLQREWSAWNDKEYEALAENMVGPNIGLGTHSLRFLLLDKEPEKGEGHRFEIREVLSTGPGRFPLKKAR